MENKEHVEEKSPPAVPVPFFRPITAFCWEDIVKEVMDSGIFVKGPKVQALETNFAIKYGLKAAVAVNSGSTALLLALMAAGVGPGSEVIVPEFTFFGSVAPVVFLRATPVFVAVTPEGLMDVSRVSRAITSITRAIIPVHLYGKMVDMIALRDLVDKQNAARPKVLRRGDYMVGMPQIMIIEDCAQAQGASCGHKFAGAWGDYAAFSFYPTKIMSAYGDGGLLAVNVPGMVNSMRALVDHGRMPGSSNEVLEYHHILPGLNFRMSEIVAALLIRQLAMVESRIQERAVIAHRYTKRLVGSPFMVPLGGIRRVFCYYTVFFNSAMERNHCLHYLKKRGIDARIQYDTDLQLVVNHMTTNVRLMEGYLHGEGAGHLEDRVLSLPLYPGMPLDDQERVITAVKEWERECDEGEYARQYDECERRWVAERQPEPGFIPPDGEKGRGCQWR